VRPLELQPIGLIRSPFGRAEGTPIQPAYAGGTPGTVVLAAEWTEALDDLDGFERIWLLYWMDRVGAARAKVVPYRDDRERGLLATRSPCRPNPIGLSVVRLVRREANVLHVADMDVLDGTPLLDVKPYVPAFDAFPGARAGWFDLATTDRRIADSRFHEPASGGPVDSDAEE
jgi:tRNA-Thr(GGU) m(6)t(6)A37 methyltransferase TsaA